MPELPRPAELPDRPDLDQLRRQARELQRAATAGDPEALQRLKAVSAEATLTGAQLAIARELGYPSWTKLKEEVERRRTAGITTSRWSLGCGPPLTLEPGVFSPGALLVDESSALLEGTFVPSRDIRTGPPPAWRKLVRRVPLAPRRLRVHHEMPLLQLRALHATDDKGAVYAVRRGSAAGVSRQSGRARVLEKMHVFLSIDPAPPRDVQWVELRDDAGAASRLLPARRASIAIGDTGSPTPATARSFGDLSPFDIGVELPFPDGMRIRVDCLVPEDEDAWRLYLRVRPHWWRTREEGQEREPVVNIAAEDDLGGAYTGRPTHGRPRDDCDDVTLEFRPGLDRRASQLTLRFSGVGPPTVMQVSPGE